MDPPGIFETTTYFCLKNSWFFRTSAPLRSFGLHARAKIKTRTWHSSRLADREWLRNNSIITGQYLIPSITQPTGFFLVTAHLQKSCCWWFRNPIPNHRLDVFVHPVNNGMNYELPYQQYHFWQDWRFDRVLLLCSGDPRCRLKDWRRERQRNNWSLVTTAR